MSAGGDVVVWLLIFFLYWAACRLHTWYTNDDIPTAQYFCPAAEDRVPLNEYDASPIVWKDGVSAYGYRCSVCGSVHVYDLGIAPCPIYQGDKLKFKLTSEGLAQAEYNAN